MFQDFSKVVKETLSSLWEERIRITTLLSLGFLFLWFGEKSHVEVLSHLAVEMFGAIVIFLFLESGIEKIKQLSWSQIEECRQLPVVNFLDKLKKATNRVRILDIWLYSLTNDDNGTLNSFRESLKEALRNNVEIQILVIQPDAEVAQQRARELDEVVKNGSSIIKQRFTSLLLLKQLVENSIDTSNKIEIKIYNVLPSIAMYQCDDEVYWSFYPLDGISTSKPQLKLPIKTQLGDYLSTRFEEIWNDHSTIPIEKYNGGVNEESRG